jgi:ABC-type transport system substrate-binding protein
MGMTSFDRSVNALSAGGPTRRRFLAGATALGLAGPLLGPSSPAAAQPVPKRGGTLRIGAPGGGSTETLDPSQAANTVTIINSFMVYGFIVEYDVNRRILPSVAERREPRAARRNGSSTSARASSFTTARHSTPKTSSIR